MGVAVKLGINTTFVITGNENFTQLCPVADLGG